MDAVLKNDVAEEEEQDQEDVKNQEIKALGTLSKEANSVAENTEETEV